MKQQPFVVRLIVQLPPKVFAGEEGRREVRGQGGTGRRPCSGRSEDRKERGKGGTGRDRKEEAEEGQEEEGRGGTGRRCTVFS